MLVVRGLAARSLSLRSLAVAHAHRITDFMNTEHPVRCKWTPEELHNKSVDFYYWHDTYGPQRRVGTINACHGDGGMIYVSVLTDIPLEHPSGATAGLLMPDTALTQAMADALIRHPEPSVAVYQCIHDPRSAQARP